MHVTRFFKSAAVVAMIGLMVPGVALAQRGRDGRDGRDGGGRGDRDGSVCSSDSSRTGSSRSVVRPPDVDHTLRSAPEGTRTFRSDRETVIRPSEPARTFQGTRQYEARRPTGEVRDFLGTRERSPKDREMVDRE